MSDNTRIEWTNATCDRTRGCDEFSAGCKHCCAETFAERFQGQCGSGSAPSPARSDCIGRQCTQLSCLPPATQKRKKTPAKLPKAWLRKQASKLIEAKFNALEAAGGSNHLAALRCGLEAKATRLKVGFVTTNMAKERILVELTWLGVQHRPQRPLSAETLAVAKQQLDDLERWVRQKVEGGWTPPKPSQPQEASPATTGKRRKRSERPDEYELNIRIKQYLDQHPGAVIRDVAAAVDLSTGKVSKMDAWQREMAQRNAAKKPTKKDARPLTPEMLACIGKKDNMDDVDARIDAEDAVWRRIIEESDEQKRAELHAMNGNQKRRLIEAAKEHYADRLTEEDQ